MPVVLILYVPIPKHLIVKRVPAVSHRVVASAWVKSHLLDRIQISGQRTLGYHRQDVEGDGDAFNSLNYYGQGSQRFTDIGQAQVSGRKVLGVLNFDFQLANNRFGDPQGQRTSINYENHGFTADLGDIQGRLINSNMFANFSKSLKGAMVGYKAGRMEMRAVRSNVKAAARTVSLQGNGGPGPYYLNANQLVQDSEQVRVDDETLKLGTDYTMDYQVGAITFISRSIPQTSTILVSFEELGVNSKFGTITGGSFAYDLGRAGKLGFTHVEQRSAGTAGLGTRTDAFQGYGAPETPYTLEYQPLTTYPIVIKLDGLLQTEGVDYRFDTGNSAIFYFLRYVPDSSTIEVTYTPKPTSTVNGDRRVSGWDYQLPFKGGMLNYSQASGSLFNTPTPTSGTARGLNLDYTWKKWNFRGSVRDVPQGFVGIETLGFNRNERSSSWMISRDAGRVQYSLTGSNSSITNRTEDSDGNVTYAGARTTYVTANTKYAGARGVTYNLSQSRVTSTGSSTDTKLDLTTFSANKAFGKLATQWSLQRTAGVGLLTSTDGTTSQGSLSSNSIGLSTKYPAGRGWFVGGKYSLSDTSSAAIHGLGTDANLNVGFHPERGPLTSDVSLVYSKSGTLAALSDFSTGLGYGYDSGSFSSGASGSSVTNSATDEKILSWVTSLRLNSRARLDTHMTSAERTGSVSSNTRTLGIGTGLQMDLNHSTNLAFSLENSRTSYIGSDVRSRNTTLDASLIGNIGSKWNYRLGSSFLLTSGGDYAQNRWSFESSVSRRLSAMDRVSFQFQSGRSLGYQPQEDGSMSLSYSRNIFNNIALVGSYRIRNLSYLDGNTSSGGYRSRGFDLELSFDFGR